MACATVSAQWRLVVRETQCCGFHTFVITHFNTIALTFRGWFQRIRKKGTTWLASVFAHTLLMLRRTLSALSNSVFHKIELIHKCSIVPSCKWRAALCYCAATILPKIASSSTDCFQISGGDDLRLSYNHLMLFCVYKKCVCVCV
jgi:hypothetical protein